MELDARLVAGHRVGLRDFLDVHGHIFLEHTASVLEPILRWLIPSLTDERFELIHHLIRKSAHFSEYFVFCLFLYRGVRAGRKGWRWTWGIAALSVVPVYYVLDLAEHVFERLPLSNEIIWCLWIPPYAAASIAWYRDPDRFPFASKLLVIATSIFMLGVSFSSA